jgi:propanediol utilization protein
MVKRKVKFRLERVYNEELGVWECVVHRQGMKTQHVCVARKDIALVAIVANTMSCVFDNVVLRENDNIEFELTAKINQ